MFVKMKNMVLGLLVTVVVIALVLIGLVHLVQVYERVGAKRPQVAVTIPEGSTVYDIDRILIQNGVLHPGDALPTSSEGELFPDTYYFFSSSTIGEVEKKFADNFRVKVDPSVTAQDLIVASIVQKEVTSSTDMAIVAGIIDKRLAANIQLDIDATICYIKQMQAAAIASAATSTAGCYPLSPSDFKIDSPYNTYRYRGLPPAPIDNPGVVAIQAALAPASSSYWYYLSDPGTGNTIYAVTLAQQNANREKYLAR